jgi:hypothetical protein
VHGHELEVGGGRTWALTHGRLERLPRLRPSLATTLGRSEGEMRRPHVVMPREGARARGKLGEIGVGRWGLCRANDELELACYPGLVEREPRTARLGRERRRGRESLDPREVRARRVEVVEGHFSACERELGPRVAPFGHEPLGEGHHALGALSRGARRAFSHEARALGALGLGRREEPQHAARDLAREVGIVRGVEREALDDVGVGEAGAAREERHVRGREPRVGRKDLAEELGGAREVAALEHGDGTLGLEQRVAGELEERTIEQVHRARKIAAASACLGEQHVEPRTAGLSLQRRPDVRFGGLDATPAELESPSGLVQHRVLGGIGHRTRERPIDGRGELFVVGFGEDEVEPHRREAPRRIVGLGRLGHGTTEVKERREAVVGAPPRRVVQHPSFGQEHTLECVPREALDLVEEPELPLERRSHILEKTNDFAPGIVGREARLFVAQHLPARRLERHHAEEATPVRRGLELPREHARHVAPRRAGDVAPSLRRDERLDRPRLRAFVVSPSACARRASTTCSGRGTCSIRARCSRAPSRSTSCRR